MQRWLLGDGEVEQRKKKKPLTLGRLTRSAAKTRQCRPRDGRPERHVDGLEMVEFMS